MLVRMKRNWNSYTFLGGIQNETATLENILVVSYKSKHTLAMQLCNPTLGIYPSEMKTCVQRPVPECYSGFIVIAPN